MDEKLSPETLRDLERHCDELFATYRRAMDKVTKLEREWRAAHRYQRGHPSPEMRQQEYEYERGRSKIRNKANEIRRHAETILAVLEWAAPDKRRDERLRRMTVREGIFAR